MKKEYPFAFYVHCASHRLNLCAEIACNIQPGKLMMSLVMNVLDFLINLARR